MKCNEFHYYDDKEALIEKTTGKKIACSELHRNEFYYYDKSGRLIAKYNPAKGVLKTF